MEIEKNNLDTFRILFIVKGILNILFSLFFILYAFFGGFFLASDFDQKATEAPFSFGWIFIVIGMVGFILAVLFGIVTLMAAKYIGQRRKYNFILVISILNCLTGILGILLGVFTIIEINKPHVKTLFNKA